MAENLYDMLKNKDLVYLFREFLHTLKGAENLAFWLEVEIYKRVPDDELARRGREIWNKYFDPSSKYELNVEGKLRKELQEALKNPDRTTFDGCQYSIWKMMEQDCFPKFLQSPQYKEYRANQPIEPKEYNDGGETERNRRSTIWMVEDFFEDKK